MPGRLIILSITLSGSIQSLLLSMAANATERSIGLRMRELLLAQLKQVSGGVGVEGPGFLYDVDLDDEASLRVEETIPPYTSAPFMLVLRGGFEAVHAIFDLAVWLADGRFPRLWFDTLTATLAELVLSDI